MCVYVYNQLKQKETDFNDHVRKEFVFGTDLFLFDNYDGSEAVRRPHVSGGRSDSEDESQVLCLSSLACNFCLKILAKIYQTYFL